MGLTGRVVVIAGATSASGVATARALVDAGALVVAVGSNAERLAAFASAVPPAETRLCDLSRLAAVTGLAASVRSEFGRVDGLIHLVGGWRGSRGLADQSDEDWAAMEAGFTTLRNTSRAFFDDLVASDAGRLAIVSSTSADKPSAGQASYAAAKSAAETWVRAVADGFRRAQSAGTAGGTSGGEDAQGTDAGAAASTRQRAAAVSFVVMALVDPDMRRANPGKPYEGFTEVETLARAVVALWYRDAAELNGVRLPLTP